MKCDLHDTIIVDHFLPTPLLPPTTNHSTVCNIGWDTEGVYWAFLAWRAKPWLVCWWSATVSTGKHKTRGQDTQHIWKTAKQQMFFWIGYSILMSFSPNGPLPPVLYCG